MEIRPSTPFDRDAVLRFIEEMEFTRRDVSTWDGLAMRAMLALEGGQIIGAIPIESREVFIDQNRSIKCAHETCVAIHPDYRNYGIGTKLQQALIEQNTDHDLLTVFREEPGSDSYRWYLKCGFAPILEMESLSLDESLIGEMKLAGPNDDFDNRPSAKVAIDIRPFERFDRDEIEPIWQRSNRPGFVDRTKRSLFDWLSIHPYKSRYRFHIAREMTSGALAVLGIGKLHSVGERIDVLACTSERLSTLYTFDAALRDWAAHHHYAPIRWALARRDPMVQQLRDIDYRSVFPFSLLARPLRKIEIDSSTWKYAAIDFI